MAGLFPSVGCADIWTQSLGTNSHTLAPYTNNVTPAKGNTLATYTLANQPVAGTPINWTLAPASWVITVVGSNGQAQYPQVSVTVDGAISLYGIVIYRGSTLVYAERFSGAPLVIGSSGVLLKLQPTLQDT